MTFKYNKTAAWEIILLCLRIWLGYRMITASYSSVTGMLFSDKERAFFIKWFGGELHFPFPLQMAFLAKGAEYLGGILVLVGLFTRYAAFLIFFTMFIATVTANLGQDFNIDGGFTISYALFAIVLMFWGGGKYSLDRLFRRKASSVAVKDAALV